MNIKHLIISIALGATLLSGAGCSGPGRVEHENIRTVDRGRMRRQFPTDDQWVPPLSYGMSAAARVDYPFLQDELEAFAGRILEQSEGGWVGCLPPVSHDPVRARGHRFVSVLSERLARRVTESLPEVSPALQPVSPDGMRLLLADKNLGSQPLENAQDIAAYGNRLGLDKLVFGRITRHDDVGWPGRTMLRVVLSAYDFPSNRVVADCSFDLFSDNDLTVQAYDDFFVTGTWNRATSSHDGSLAGEVRAVTDLLARQLLQDMDPASIDGIVYVAPAYTGGFVREVHDLRASQRVFGNEVIRRQEAADRTGQPLDWQAGLVLPGGTFDSLQQAHSYISEQNELLLTTRSAGFCRKLSRMLGQHLQPLLRPHEVWVNDLGSTKWSDTQLIEGEMATGGLTSSLHARQAMKAVGIRIAVQPFLEKWGDGYVLRVAAYDLEKFGLASSRSAEIAPLWWSHMQAEVALDGELTRAPEAAAGQPREAQPVGEPAELPPDAADIVAEAVAGLAP